MIRCAEAVLDGHPDRFCDLVADRVIEEALRADPQAPGQIEVSCWKNRVWLTGTLVTGKPLKRSLRELVVEVGKRVGYTGGHAPDAAKFTVEDHVDRVQREEGAWSDQPGDQSIVVGWAGYDDKVDYLPPEQFLALAFRDALMESLRTGVLKGEGPDGKLLVRIKEDQDAWRLEQVLVSLQHRSATALKALERKVSTALEEAYRDLRVRDPRWTASWPEVDLPVNPNGVFLTGGPEGDNGQTGRKQVMDNYGPRIPIGGGALHGKDSRHVDRAGARTARSACLRMVREGAQEVMVNAVFGPNCDAPLDVNWSIEGCAAPPGIAEFMQDLDNGTIVQLLLS